MTRMEFDCQALCDPANQVCFRRADRGLAMTRIDEALKSDSLSLKEDVISNTEWLRAVECRMSSIALSMKELEDSMKTDS